MSEQENKINVIVTFRHTESTEALRKYAEEKVLHSVNKFKFTDPTEVHVILSCEKRDHTAEAKVSIRGNDIAAKATTTDLYSAIDKMVDTVATQLRKHKEKITSSRHTTLIE